MLGVWLLVRHRAIAGAVLVTLAALVKPYAIVALPSFWRPWDWRVPAAVVATIVLCYLPYLGVGRGVLGFVTPGGYLGEEGFADGEGFWLVALVRTALGNVPGLTIAYLLAAAGMMAWLGVRAAWRTDRTPETTLRDIAVLLMAGHVRPVAELCLVLPGRRAVHRAGRRRAGLGHDAGRAPALQAAHPARQRPRLENAGDCCRS